MDPLEIVPSQRGKHATGDLVSCLQIGVAVRGSGCGGASLRLRQERREQFFGFARVPGIAVVIRGHIAFLNCLLILAGLSSSIVYPNDASERKNLGRSEENTSEHQ